jgi:hypothetical protein
VASWWLVFQSQQFTKKFFGKSLSLFITLYYFTEKKNPTDSWRGFWFIFGLL